MNVRVLMLLLFVWGNVVVDVYLILGGGMVEWEDGRFSFIIKGLGVCGGIFKFLFLYFLKRNSTLILSC